MKYFCKNIHIFLLCILLILLFLLLQRKYFHYEERFIGKNKSIELSDLGDETKIEKKEYQNFPPLKNQTKYDLMNHIFGSNHTDSNNNHNDSNENDYKKEVPISMPKIQSAGVQELEKSELQKEFSKIDEQKPLLGNCDFYFNKCPANKSSMATIKGNNLTCGKNGQETKRAEAIAQIKNGYISKITIINGGIGYNYQNPPKVKIMSNNGNGASAKANVDKNGVISSIDIIDYGYGYVETPTIEIEAPQMDGVCHLCC